MAKKNEILISIALEGDSDVKSKLQQVGEAGKKSLADTEKRLGDAGSRIGKRLAEPLGQVSEAISPLLEASGLGRLGGLLEGGLIGRFFGTAGPAAAFAALSGLALHLAKVGEASDKTKLKFKALGASDDTLEKLSNTSKELGVSTEDLKPSFEKSAEAKNKVNADQSSGVIRLRPDGATAADEAAAGVRIISGGKETGAAVPDKVSIGALKTLIEGAQAEKIPGDEAGKIATSFISKVQQDRKLTPEAVDTLNPTSQNILAKSLSSFFGGTVQNGAELKERLARPGQRVPSDNEVFRSLNEAEPEAKKQADAARGVTAAFDGVAASAGRLDEVFGKVAGGPINKVLTEGIDKVAGGIDKAGELIERNAGSIEKGAELGHELGSKTPIPFAGVGGAIVGGIAGGTIGVGSELAQAVDEKYLQKGAPAFLKNALVNPAAIAGNTAQPLPDVTGFQSPLTPESLASTKIPSPLESVSLKALLLGSPLAGAARILPDLFGLTGGQQPEHPASPQAPAQTEPLKPPQQVGAVEPPQPAAAAEPPRSEPVPLQQGPLSPQSPAFVQDIAGAVTSLLNQLRERLAGPENKVINTPADSIGIRGEAAPEQPTNVAALNDAAGAAADGLKQFASLLIDALSSVRTSAGGRSSSGGPTPVGDGGDVAAAAGGGEIRRLDYGGHVSGPGTTTSDSIPAMLSDGEYVIRAAAARKLGRGVLDGLNAGHFAEGGKVARLARGGGLSPEWSDPDLTPEESIDLLNRTVLSPQQLKLIALNNAKTPEESIKLLNRFVLGHSGGGPIGHFASGGAVDGDSIGHLLSGFAAGGDVAGGQFALPPLADAMDFSALSPPALDPSGLAPTSPWGDMPHFGTMDFRSNFGDVRAIGPEDVLRQMSAAATTSAMMQTGTMPAWYKGP